MSNQTTSAITEQPAASQQAPISISVSSDAILILGVLVWVVWDKVMKPSVTDKLDGVFAPVQEERRLNNILAQIGIVTKASRVVLAAFHDGSLDNAGYHLQKLSIVNTYTAPGHNPITHPIHDLPIGRIMFEIEEMLKNDGKWVCAIYDESLPEPCRDHLLRNDIEKMCNKLVKVGNLPIGILSIQYAKGHGSDMEGHYASATCPSSVVSEEYEQLMEDLYYEISTILRRRVIHPSPIHKAFGTLLGTLKIKK